MLKKIVSLLAAVVVASGFAVAEQSPAEQVAQAYIQAYSEADVDAMAPYMAEDIVFEDQTNPNPDFQSEYVGKAAVLEMIQGFVTRSGVIELGFDFPVVFESNGRIVFSGTVNVHSAPPGAEHAYKWRARQVTILTIEDGKVVHHEDFADYGGATVTQLERPAE